MIGSLGLIISSPDTGREQNGMSNEECGPLEGYLGFPNRRASETGIFY
jgi:hypothetical protein